MAATDARTEAERLRDAGLGYADLAAGLHLSAGELRHLRRRDRAAAVRRFLAGLVAKLRPARRPAPPFVPIPPINSWVDPCSCGAAPGQHHQPDCPIVVSPIVLDTGKPARNSGPLDCPYCGAGTGDQHSADCAAI
jgi:hypothetical protein